MPKTLQLRIHRPLLAILLVGIALFWLAGQAHAGGGPENVLLVVNPKSPASLTIANHYIQLRHIPASNVFYLPWDPKAETTDIETFRQQILKPVLTVARSRPGGQIDYVVYSSDFPWGINLDADVKKFAADAEKMIESGVDKTGQKVEATRPSLLKVLTPEGSITGLTYLWEPVIVGHSGYLNLRNNFYMRRPVPEQKDAATVAFSSSQRFGGRGELSDTRGIQYLLSVMLGVTSGRGNSVAEVLDYLRRSAGADGAHPKGTIYYCQNGDIRSKVRQEGFIGAVRALKELGVTAEIIDGAIPMKKKDVQGTMVGISDFDWPGSGSSILPGAICEHFTSFGGILSAGASQTPLSVFLRYGAAGASGTVTEPYAVPMKFPDAMIQVHYARGCTLAEAFYQSVYGPYQLLIVGDPLCRPWANIPRVSVAGVPAGGKVTGLLTMKPTATLPGKSGVDHFELFVDGVRTLRCQPTETLPLDTAALPDGFHELRVVAVEAGPIRSQGRQIMTVQTDNHGATIEVSASPRQTVQTGQSLVVTAKTPGCVGILVQQGGRLLGRIAGEQGQLEISPATLGNGPVRLQVVGLGADMRTKVVAKPVELEVRE
jgi:hypothetical protein